MMFRSYSNISKNFLRDYGTIAMVIILGTMVTITTVICSRVNAKTSAVRSLADICFLHVLIRLISILGFHQSCDQN